ncbi:hypothetical protein QCA50_020469 [Cerrena zonata]|uniref:Uncharacterized protein n=1 Tax=Cerrena zonata TaxID=2478898 RepID=A0AAW0FGC3_9APHY
MLGKGSLRAAAEIRDGCPLVNLPPIYLARLGEIDGPTLKQPVDRFMLTDFILRQEECAQQNNTYDKVS